MCSQYILVVQIIITHIKRVLLSFVQNKAVNYMINDIHDAHMFWLVKMPRLLQT